MANEKGNASTNNSNDECVVGHALQGLMRIHHEMCVGKSDNPCNIIPGFLVIFKTQKKKKPLIILSRCIKIKMCCCSNGFMSTEMKHHKEQKNTAIKKMFCLYFDIVLTLSFRAKSSSLDGNTNISQCNIAEYKHFVYEIRTLV